MKGKGMENNDEICENCRCWRFREIDHSNDLVYGNGGLVGWPRETCLQMKTHENAKQKEAEDNREEEEAAAGGYNVGETSENKAGGRFMNKGGLASRKKKKKK